MKAPDKIFVNVDPFGFIRAYDIENHPSWGEEYIRKDALLELLKPEKDISFCDDYERGWIDGRNSIREELLDELNKI